jgi:hypothetical protein
MSSNTAVPLSCSECKRRKQKVKAPYLPEDKHRHEAEAGLHREPRLTTDVVQPRVSLRTLPETRSIPSMQV